MKLHPWTQAAAHDREVISYRKNSARVVSKYPSFFVVVAVPGSSGTSTFAGIHAKPY
jgi:hypothetical protein